MSVHKLENMKPESHLMISIMIRSLAIIAISFCVICSTTTFAGEKAYVKPSAVDKCPVCGMFAFKYPDWVAEVIFRDGAYRVFDGPKDMFKYLFNLKKYDPSRKQAEIVTIYVSDYYSVNPIDAYNAYFVIGSNIYGPMGPEFIPFEREADAKEFFKDHLGKRILRFRDITPRVLGEFD
jgi:copper chaperone NosL